MLFFRSANIRCGDVSNVREVYTKKPLGEMGIVPAQLGKILAPTPEPPMEKKKASTKRLQKGRVLTSSQIVGELRVRDVQNIDKAFSYLWNIPMHTCLFV
ncbi:hypothetical protein DPMN_108303 [Dreissena polymorpha]|uniref:Uncharacterized protein n=1 Tax=Dreissena polymorpha TaxID=45954 RepID=A0A9D4K8L6_DREPO|nr:hypothetical protein DPMN_108303 [Dreissena polymorpha]